MLTKLKVETFDAGKQRTFKYYANNSNLIIVRASSTSLWP